MLIINNGVPKSGSSWMQSILTKALIPSRPSEEFRNSWMNPSIDQNKLASYVQSKEWKNKCILIKMHFAFNNSTAFLLRDGIKIVVTHRNLADSVVSMFYHQLRNNKITTDKAEWFRTTGIEIARKNLNYRNSWKDVSNALLVSYEKMLEDPVGQISKTLQFLGADVPNEKILELAKSKLTIQSEKDVKNEEFVRSPGFSTARSEMPKEIFDQITAMEKE